jgi:hypothetical protein
MKLTFLFIVLIFGLWLATTAFGRMFEGMDTKAPTTQGKKDSPSMDEVLEQAKVAIEKVSAKDTATKKADAKKM